MAYKLPEDIVNKLKIKFPAIDVEQFFQTLIELIIEKTTNMGSTTIREFGRFFAYKVFSTRKQCETVRFKFKVTWAFQDKLGQDPYILQNLILQDINKFDDSNEEKCKDKRSKRKETYETIQTSIKSGKVDTENQMARDEILKILNGD